MRLLREPEEWERGAKGLEVAEFADGLLFKLHQAATWPVTMAGVLVPIDAYWLSESGMVVEHAELFPGLPDYWPDQTAKYVLEFPMLASPRYKIGDFVELPPS